MPLAVWAHYWNKNSCICSRCGNLEEKTVSTKQTPTSEIVITCIECFYKEFPYNVVVVGPEEKSGQ